MKNVSLFFLISSKTESSSTLSTIGYKLREGKNKKQWVCGSGRWLHYGKACIKKKIKQNIYLVPNRGV
jgi:hypothetical protein